MIEYDAQLAAYAAADAVASAEEYRSASAELMRRARPPRAKVLPDYRRASTQGNTPAGRDTQASPHPMRTVRTTLGSLRSSNPAIRRAAQTAAIRLGLIERKAVETTRTPWRRPSKHPFAAGTRRTREG